MKDINRLSVDILNFGNRAIDNIMKAQSDTAYVIQQDAKFLAPEDTGVYKETIELGETQVNNGIITTSVYTDATVYTLSGTSYNLGRLLEEGTRPHEIRATNAPVLHFKIMGEDVFAKSVFHPGTIAQPHFLPALNMNRALYVENIRKAVKEAK